MLPTRPVCVNTSDICVYDQRDWDFFFAFPPSVCVGCFLLFFEKRGKIRVSTVACQERFLFK